MKILLVDNYDSYVYNVVGLLQRCRRVCKDLEWDVVKNDALPIAEMSQYDGIILSPGPGIPSEAGQMMTLIRKFSQTHPMLGICLGCQAIAEAFGGALRCLPSPRHGHCSQLREIDELDPIVGFYSRTQARVGRYHSWVVDEASLGYGARLKITSRDEEGNIMSLRHTDLSVFGVQFHPESVISDGGEQLLLNFLRLCSKKILTLGTFA